MARTVTIYGGWGELDIDPETGRVLHYEPGGDYDPAKPMEGYAEILRVDLDEWRIFLTRHGLDEYDRCDVLNVGYWTAWGVYVPPAHDYRDEWLPHALGYAAHKRLLDQLASDINDALK